MSTSVDFSQNGQDTVHASTAKKINCLINSSKTRLEGLQLLNLFLPQCPDEDFVSFCVSWMQNCCKLDNLTKNRNFQAQLLCNLFKTSSNFSELKKSVSFFITTRYFDFFFKYLLNSEAGWICTETCLCLYRGACGPFQAGLEKHLMCEVEKNVNVPLPIARCLALLPSTGGGGNDGVNYKKNWRSQFLKFLSICHSVLNDLLADVEEFQEDVINGHKPSTNGCERNVEHLAIQFQNYCSVLDFMLLNQYPAPKSVPPDLIFQLICRGLAPNPQALAKHCQTADILSLQKVLPEVQRSLFSLLKAAIITCKNQLLPYSHLICKLIKQSLQCTESDVPHGNEKQFESLRISTYETLCDWLVIARNGSCVEVISDVIVSNAVNDVKSKKGVVFLKEMKSQNQPRSTRKMDASANSELCLVALKTLQFLLKFAGVLLKADVHKFLQEAAVKLLVEVQKSLPKDIVIPFALPPCRIALYRFLLELVQQPCRKWPPPTNFALRLFAAGINDSSPEVSSFCSAALNYTTIIIHPQYDNGGFPLGDASESRIRTESSVPWEEDAVPMEVVPEKGTETPTKPNESAASEKVVELNEGSEFSSDEDSRNTVTFSKDIGDLATEASRVGERTQEEVLFQGSPAAEDDFSSGKRISPGKVPPPKSASPVGGNQPKGTPSNLPETPETNKVKKLGEGDRAEDSADPKSISPESTSEDGHPKGRYFLRSKTKASSEEPEEALKRASSVESLKGTPAKAAAKMAPSVQTPAKRPRTRALSKTGGNGETGGRTPPKTGQEDEDDIRAAFHDSFID